MIEVNLRNKNSIINLIAVGKVPIRGKTAPSPYFHSPLELLLSSLGLCIGGIIVNYCRLNDLNTDVFESITIKKDYSFYVITIQRPEDFDKIHLDRIEREITSCSVSKELIIPIKVNWIFNSISTEELIKEKEKPCCGG